MNVKIIAAITNENAIDVICTHLQKTVESMIDVTNINRGNSHIRNVMRIMSDRYAEPLTLESVAEAVELSPHYLSSLFKRIIGVSFREQLNIIRIRESKNLLLSSNYSLAEIAVAMGFSD